MKWIIIGIAGLLAAGSASIASTPSVKMERAMISAVNEVAAADKAIACHRQASPIGYSCAQSVHNDRDHYAALSVTVRAAGKPLRAGAIIVERTFMGPGGAITTYVGQTTDRRYDIVVTHADNLGPKDRPRLPPASRLITRIATLYAAKP